MRSTGQDQQKTYNIWRRLHIDVPLLAGILSLMILGLFIVYSAGGQSVDMAIKQARNMGIALTVMILVDVSFSCRFASVNMLKSQLAAIRFLKNSDHIDTLQKQQQVLQNN